MAQTPGDKERSPAPSRSSPIALERRDCIVIYGASPMGAAALMTVLNTELERLGRPEIGSEKISETYNVTYAFYNRYPLEPQEETLPTGVIVFPHMEQETPTGTQLVDPPAHIGGLCRWHRVPMIEVQQADETGPIPADLAAAAGLAWIIAAQQETREIAVQQRLAIGPSPRPAG